MKNVMKMLLFTLVMFFSVFFIDVWDVNADNCIRCTYNRTWYVGGSQTEYIEDTMQKKHVSIQLVIKEKDGKVTIDKTKCDWSVTSAAGGGNGRDSSCTLYDFDKLNNSKTLKSKFFSGKQLGCASMNPSDVGKDQISLTYGPSIEKKFGNGKAYIDKSSVGKIKSCDLKENTTGFEKDEPDPYTDGIPDPEENKSDQDTSAITDLADDSEGDVNQKGEVGCFLIPPSIMDFLNNLLVIIQVIGILLLVIMTMIEFIKVITASSEDGLKGAFKNTIRRIIVIVVLLLVPTIVIWLLNIANDNRVEIDEFGNPVIGEDGNPVCSDGYFSFGGSSGSSRYGTPGTGNSENWIIRASVDKIPNQKWTKKAIKPKVTVKMGGKKLTLNKDYTLKYKNNINPGTASVIIKGKGKYSGSKIVTFNIIGADAKVTLDKHVLMLDNYHYNIAVLEATLSKKGAYPAKDIKWKIEDGSGYSSVVRFKKGSSKLKTTTGKKVNLVGLHFGTAKVTVTLPNGKKDTCKIKVFVAATEQIGNGIDYNAGTIQSKYNGLYVMHKHSKGWGNEYVEAYVNNAEWILKNKPNKFPGESKSRTIETYKRADLKIHTNDSKRIITSVSGGRWSNFSRSHAGSGWQLYKTVHKKKGELSGNNYVLLHIYKDQWLYLLKKSGGKYKVINSRRSSTGTRYSSFNCFFLDMRYDTRFPSWQTGLTMIGTCYDKSGAAGIQAAHTDFHPKASKQGKPDSNGCMHIGTTQDHRSFQIDHNPTMYYDLFVKAGPGTRLILA